MFQQYPYKREPEIKQNHPAEVKIPDFDLEIAVDVFRCFEDNMDKCCDFTVNVGDTKFNCHRFVLSSCSGFFEALMRTDMREKSESSCTIMGITPEIFGLILDVIYKGRNVLNEGNMLEIWHAANQLQIKLLITASEKFVKNNITVLNYRAVLTNAEMLNSSSVIAKVKEVLAKSYYELVCLGDFMKVSLEELLEILNSEYLNVCPDFRVESVLKWAGAETNSTYSPNHFVENFKAEANAWHRRTCLNQLLAVIPLQNTTTEYLSKLMNNEYMLENKNAMRIVNGVAATRLDVIVRERKKIHKLYAECKHCNQVKKSSHFHVGSSLHATIPSYDSSDSDSY